MGKTPRDWVGGQTFPLVPQPLASPFPPPVAGYPPQPEYGYQETQETAREAQARRQREEDERQEAEELEEDRRQRRELRRMERDIRMAESQRRLANLSNGHQEDKKDSTLDALVQLMREDRAAMQQDMKAVLDAIQRRDSDALRQELSKLQQQINSSNQTASPLGYLTQSARELADAKNAVESLFPKPEPAPTAPSVNPIIPWQAEREYVLRSAETNAMVEQMRTDRDLKREEMAYKSKRATDAMNTAKEMAEPFLEALAADKVGPKFAGFFGGGGVAAAPELAAPGLAPSVPGSPPNLQIVQGNGVGAGQEPVASVPTPVAMEPQSWICIEPTCAHENWDMPGTTEGTCAVCGTRVSLVES